VRVSFFWLADMSSLLAGSLPYVAIVQLYLKIGGVAGIANHQNEFCLRTDRQADVWLSYSMYKHKAIRRVAVHVVSFVCYKRSVREMG
jgi:hypothetical protein